MAVRSIARHFFSSSNSARTFIRRNFHLSAIASGTKVNLKPAEDGMYLQLESTSKSLPLLLHSTWLRDHCRCPQCFDRVTKHKMVEIKALDGLRPQQVKLENEQLLITWPDGHQSSYSIDWLWDNVYDGYKEIRKSHKKLWNSGMVGLNVMENVVTYDDFMASDDALKQVLNTVIHYGFAAIQKGPATPESAVTAAERLGPLRLGFFGEVMKFQSNMLHHKHGDSCDKIVPHTDQSYLTEPAGLKVVSCLNTGGSAFLSLVDGFCAAEDLKVINPLAYETLSKVQVPFEFTSDAFMHRTQAPLLQHDLLTSQLSLVRYNMYYRCALSASQYEEMDRFYTALNAFSKLVQAPTRAVRLAPVSGTIYLVDNWRILTSMGQFRERGIDMAGCYVGYSDYTSLARRLGVIKSPKSV